MTEVTLVYHGDDTFFKREGAPLEYPVGSDLTVTQEVYKRAFNEETKSIGQLREELTQAGKQGEELERELNDKIVERIREFENLQKITKLRWIASFQILEQRLKIATAEEKERVRKSDRAYKSKRSGLEGEGETKKVRAAPKTKEEKALAVLMAMGYSKEQAEAQLKMMPPKS